MFAFTFVHLRNKPISTTTNVTILMPSNVLHLNTYCYAKLEKNIGATRTLSHPPHNLKNCQQNFEILLYEGEVGNVNYYFC